MPEDNSTSGLTFQNLEVDPASVPKTLLSREIGQPGIVTSARFIQDVRKTDLKDFPTRLCTFDNMCNDSAVATSIFFTNIHVVNALYKGKFVPGESNNRVAKEAANFLNYNIRMMPVGSWWESMINAATDLKYGCSFLNMVVKVATSGPYKGMRVLHKLAPRDQKSVLGWTWDQNFREWTGFVQRKNLKQDKSYANAWLGALSELNARKYYDQGYRWLKKEQLLHFAYNTTNNNPQGHSPLISCYNAWAEKKLIEDLEASGASKDLAGLLILRVPSDLIKKAADPNNVEAQEALLALQTNAANFHTGKSAYALLASDSYQDTKKPIYDLQLVGVQGGSGKMYNTSEIIKEKKKDIFNNFGTGFMLLGQDSTGSYALSTTGQSVHGSHVEFNINGKSNVLDVQFAPRMFAINNISLKWDEYPKWESADPVEPDYSEVSKLVQRMKSVGALTPKALETLYTRMGWPVDGIEDLVFDDGDTSRGGDGMTSAGEGTSNSVDGQDHSNNNLENSGTQKGLRNFVEDKKWGLIDVEIDTPLGEIE